MGLAHKTSAICSGVNKNSGMSVSLCGFLVPDSGIQLVMGLNILGGGEFKCEWCLWVRHSCWVIAAVLLEWVYVGQYLSPCRVAWLCWYIFLISSLKTRDISWHDLALAWIMWRMCYLLVVSCPGLLHLQLLITCSLQKQTEKDWEILSHNPQHDYVITPSLSNQVTYETNLAFCASYEDGLLAAESCTVCIKHTRYL